MPFDRKKLRPLVLGLAAALFACPAFAQTMSYEERMQACNTCHGEDGNSKMEKIPSLAGQPEFFLLNQLVLMRENVRPVEPMAPFLKGIKDEEILKLAAHFSKLPPKPSDEAIDQALVAKGAEIANQKRCISCHGANLAGDQQIPRIAKQRVDYLVQSLDEFRGSKRPGADTNMSVPLAGLSDADLKALAHYAASR
jgi:cytochrome c553